MQYDQIDDGVHGSCILIRTQFDMCRCDDSRLRVHYEFAHHDYFGHDLTDMSTRLFVSDALSNRSELELSGDAARYLGKVLRARVGDALTVFNGGGAEHAAHIVQIRKSSVVLTIAEAIDTHTESPLKIHLVQGISRSDRMDLVVQKATELGVKRITPVICEYGVVKLNDERAEKRRQHWLKIATSACEQSGRTRLPLIDSPLPLKSWMGNKPDRVDVEVILKPGAATRLVAVAAPDTKVCVLVGPEGGFSDVEYGDAAACGFAAVSFGPRVLRTETAAIAALSVMQALWGDLGKR